jgi:mannose-6-phosphate isomerase
MTNLYPLTFAPVFRDYIWGGRNLETKLGRKIPDGVVAESWDISGHPSSPTQVDNGPLTGQTLPEALAQLKTDLVGTRSQDMLARGKFPLLIKLLDANKPLSVQVHPADDYANRHENGELGKTEMWYILSAEPNAYLIYGLAPNVSPDSFRAAIQAGTLEDCLHKLPVKAGDAVFIPSGSVHAIMDGIILAEIQQNSDTTYRVYDWNRVGADGKSRPLHVDKALDVINFEQVEPGPFTPQLIEARQDGLQRELITTCPYFNVEQLTFAQEGLSFKGKCDGSTFEIWGTMSGQAQVKWAGESLSLPAIRFTLLPAALGDFEIEATEPSTLLRVYVP